MYKVVDLFAGCGGMSWGLTKAGFQVIAAVDEWQPALTTFGYNHTNAKIFRTDIRALDAQEFLDDIAFEPGEIDCLIGGPPCQGFSKNVPASYRFLEDPQNQLYEDFLRFVEVLEPKTLVIENVAELYNAYGGQVRLEIVNRLIEIGYDVAVQVLFAPDYGVPQRRRRCFFFASRTGIAPTFPQPTFATQAEITLFGEIRAYRSAWSAISDLPLLENGEGHEPMEYIRPPENDYQALMRSCSAELYDHITRKLNTKQFERISRLKPGQGMKDLPDHLRPRSGYSGAYGRLDFEMLAPTITRWFFHPGSGRFCHPRETRLLTIREAARLQSFTDDFRFLGTYIEKSHQVGNAVPPRLMTALAENIKICLSTVSTVAQPLQTSGVLVPPER